jgi:hypothetical protein
VEDLQAAMSIEPANAKAKRIRLFFLHRSLTTIFFALMRFAAVKRDWGLSQRPSAAVRQ